MISCDKRKPNWAVLICFMCGIAEGLPCCGLPCSHMMMSLSDDRLSCYTLFLFSWEDDKQQGAPCFSWLKKVQHPAGLAPFTNVISRDRQCGACSCGFIGSTPDALVFQLALWVCPKLMVPLNQPIIAIISRENHYLWWFNNFGKKNYSKKKCREKCQTREMSNFPLFTIAKPFYYHCGKEMSKVPL